MLERIKQHLKDHKTEYLVGAGCFLVGAAVAVLVISKNGESVSVNAKGIFIKSPITTVLERRGHPGNLIRCDQTGEVFASQNRAADLLGISASNLSQHLSGKYAHAGGFTFTNLGEAS